ncbi:MAG: DMT family transporter [Desulfotomaculales bacterium]
MDKQTGFAYLALLLAQVFCGGAFVAAKIVVAQIDPQVAAAARFGLSFAVLMLFLVVFEKTPRPALRDWLMLAALGFTGIFLYQEFFFHGMRFAAATDGALMVASNPVFTVLLAGWFLQERVGTAQVGGLLLSVAGMLIIITKGS